MTVATNLVLKSTSSAGHADKSSPFVNLPAISRKDATVSTPSPDDMLMSFARFFALFFFLDDALGFLRLCWLDVILDDDDSREYDDDRRFLRLDFFSAFFEM